MRIKEKIFPFSFLMIFLLSIITNVIFAEGENPLTGIPRVVLVELFVQADCATCPPTEFCLEDLAWEYTIDKLVLVEEHLWGNGYDIPETNSHYDWYVGGDKKSTPDVFINGLSHRIQGLACEFGDIDENYLYYQKVVEAEIARPSLFEISANKSMSDSIEIPPHSDPLPQEERGARVVIEGRLKNINKLPLKNIVVCGMIYKEKEEPGLCYWVRDIFPFQNISLLSFGEAFSFKFVSEPLIQYEDDEELYHAVIFVQNIENKKVLQALHID